MLDHTAQTLTAQQQPLSLQPDYKLFSSFDAAIISHRQDKLIKQLHAKHTRQIHALDQEVLLNRFIKSPYLVALTPKICILLEEHYRYLQEFDYNHGIQALLSYQPAGENKPVDLARHAKMLSIKQIVRIGQQRKHLRYLDPRVVIHFIPLGKHRYLANRFNYPTRLWLSIDYEWYELNGIQHIFLNKDKFTGSSSDSRIPFTTTELDCISTINSFFAEYGIQNDTAMILNHYDRLIAWVLDAQEQLKNRQDLTNPVDRQVLVHNAMRSHYKRFMSQTNPNFN